MEKKCIGSDLDRKYSQVVVMDGSGRVLEEVRHENDMEAIEGYS